MNRPEMKKGSLFFNTFGPLGHNGRSSQATRIPAVHAGFHCFREGGNGVLHNVSAQEKTQLTRLWSRALRAGSAQLLTEAIVRTAAAVRDGRIVASIERDAQGRR